MIILRIVILFHIIFDICRFAYDICRFAYRYWRLSVSVGLVWGASRDHETNEAMIAAHRPKEYAELQEIKRRWTKSAT